MANIALEGAGDLESLTSAAHPDGDTVAETLTNLIATIGENMNIRRVETLKVGSGVVVSYMHNALAAGLGKIGVLVALESTGDVGKLEAFGKQLAMHVAAADPQALTREDVAAEDLEREKTVLAEQARASGKPDEIIEKMVEGRLRKYYEEVCLMEQTFVIDNETKVSKAVEAAGQDVGGGIKVTGLQAIRAWRRPREEGRGLCGGGCRNGRNVIRYAIPGKPCFIPEISEKSKT